MLQFSYFLKILPKDFEEELGVEKNMHWETWAKDFRCWARACIIYMMEFLFSVSMKQCSMRGSTPWRCCLLH